MKKQQNKKISEEEYKEMLEKQNSNVPIVKWNK